MMKKQAQFTLEEIAYFKEYTILTLKPTDVSVEDAATDEEYDQLCAEMCQFGVESHDGGVVVRLDGRIEARPGQDFRVTIESL